MAVLSEAEKEARREAQRKAREAVRTRQERYQAAIERRYLEHVGRFHAWQAGADRLRSLVPKALDVIEKSLEDEADPKQRMAAALAVLRAAGLGALEVPEIPSQYAIEEERDLKAIVGGVVEAPNQIGGQGIEWPELPALTLEGLGRV